MKIAETGSRCGARGVRVEHFITGQPSARVPVGAVSRVDGSWSEPRHSATWANFTANEFRQYTIAVTAAFAEYEARYGKESKP
jgi:hypothetical protein